MSLFIEEEGNIKLDFDTEEIAALVIDAALELADCPYEAEINLLLTTDDEIHRMNEEFRQIDRATDVLSFPMADYETPGDFSHLDEDAGLFHPDTGELMLGDIVISVDKVFEQAEYFEYCSRKDRLCSQRLSGSAGSCGKQQQTGYGTSDDADESADGKSEPDTDGQ